MCALLPLDGRCTLPTRPPRLLLASLGAPLHVPCAIVGCARRSSRRRSRRLPGVSAVLARVALAGAVVVVVVAVAAHTAELLAGTCTQLARARAPPKTRVPLAAVHAPEAEACRLAEGWVALACCTEWSVGSMWLTLLRVPHFPPARHAGKAYESRPTQMRSRIQLILLQAGKAGKRQVYRRAGAEIRQQTPTAAAPYQQHLARQRDKAEARCAARSARAAVASLLPDARSPRESPRPERARTSPSPLSSA